MLAGKIICYAIVGKDALLGLRCFILLGSLHIYSMKRITGSKKAAGCGKSNDL
jgi:hypothetical protein